MRLFALERLDILHETFLHYLRAFFSALGFFVGTHPWKVIAAVNLITAFAAYGALSIIWPFVPNPPLNENIINGYDESFAQQDGKPLLTKQWAKSKFAQEKVAQVIAFTKAGDDMLQSKLLRDLARVEKQVFETTLIPARNFGFQWHILDDSLTYVDFCARTCPKSEGCGCTTLSIFTLLKVQIAQDYGDDVCNDAEEDYDLDECYDRLDEYLKNVRDEDGFIVSTIQDLMAAKEDGLSSCHGGSDYVTEVGARLAAQLTGGETAGEVEALRLSVAEAVTAAFLRCTTYQATPLGAIMEEPASSDVEDILKNRLLSLSFTLGGDFAKNDDEYLINQWQRAFIEKMSKEPPPPEPAQPYAFFTTYSLDYANEETVLELISLLPFSMLVVIILVNVMLTNPRSKLAGNRMLAMACIQTSAVSPAVGMGLSAWFGIANGPLNLIVFFLCIGTAMADCFIMTAEAQRTIRENPDMPLPEYGATVLSRAGPFGLMTTITTVIAFGIGTNTVYPSMVLFAKYAMMVMSFAHFYVITYYVANLVLCQDRIRKRRHDGCPCIKITSEEPPAKRAADDDSIANTWLERLVEQYVAPAVTSPKGKAVVLTVFLTLVALSAWGATLIQSGLDSSDTVPAVSHFQGYLDARDDVKPDEGAVVYVYLSEPTAWYTEEQMRKINEETWARMSTTSLWSGSESSPWITFNQTCYFFGSLLISGLDPTPITDKDGEALTSCYQSEEAFQRALYHFLYTAPFDVLGTPARSQIVHKKDDKKERVTMIEASRMSFSNLAASSSYDRYQDLLERDEVVTFFEGMKQVSDFDTIDALEPVVVAETTLNIITGAAAVFASMMLFIKPAGAIIVVLVILFLDLMLLAFLPLTGTNLNAASSICIVMAVGFAVDYSSDIVFAFFVPASMSHDKRARLAMVMMTQPIFVGGLASVSCVLPLLAASVPTAHVFAYMVSGIVGIGIFMGFIVLPVLLTLLVPLTDEAKGLIPTPKVLPTPGVGGGAKVNQTSVES